MKKKLYISLPISGRNLDEVKERANTIKSHVLQSEYDAITPFDVCTDSTLPYGELMGRDIAALLECDAILLDYDWNESKGCRLERATAEIYHKQIFVFSDNRIVADDDSQRFSIELNKRQMRLLSKVCDEHSRNMCGQIDVGLLELIHKGIARTYSTANFDRRHAIWENVEQKLMEIKSLVWDLGRGSNYGIGYDEDSDILYDIHQVLRHHLWKIKPEPKFGMTNDAFPACSFGKEPLINVTTLTDNG